MQSRPKAQPEQRPGSAYRRVFNKKTFNEEMVETHDPEVYIEGG